jgi:hypothetical protein
MIGKSLALNTALQRKKEMAGNYRALAGTHRYDLDQAEALLREAVTLHGRWGSRRNGHGLRSWAPSTRCVVSPTRQTALQQALALAPRRNRSAYSRWNGSIGTATIRPGADEKRRSTHATKNARRTAADA